MVCQDSIRTLSVGAMTTLVEVVITSLESVPLYTRCFHDPNLELRLIKWMYQNLQRVVVEIERYRACLHEMVALLKNDTQQKRLRIENAFMGKER
jgi:hypothetical protein